MDLTIKELINFPNGLAISWNDDKETFIEYKTLRDNCPCAYCSGESDIFGNIYMSDNKISSKKDGSSLRIKECYQGRTLCH